MSTTPGARPSPVIFRPTPDELQRAATATGGAIQTETALFRQTVSTRKTATAAWVQTPEPTILPPVDGTRLRDLWPASQQQAAAPTKLYLRSPSYSEWHPDLFWEVRLSDMQMRRLPVVEQNDSFGDTALVSPDGRFLAYTTGRPAILRVLDLNTDADTGIAVPVLSSRGHCNRAVAWSPDQHTLATIEVINNGPNWTGQVLLFDPRTGPSPQPLVQLPGSSQLVGWLDTERLLVALWSRKAVEPSRLLVVDRQGNQTLLRELEPGIPRCYSLSPDGRDLIYDLSERTRRLQLATNQEEPISLLLNTFFWVGDGRTLLVSKFNRDRTVWLRPLDQPDQQQRLFLSPPYQSDYRFGITGVSPDGRLLVACEQPSGDNPRIRTSDARTWLYDIAQDRWTFVRDSVTGGCDLVAGWSTLAGAQ
ncbi:MAG: hypothetical protein OHK0022_48730 [Roseiflexaceae bacterium]